VDVKYASGKVTPWAFESLNPNALSRHGLWMGDSVGKWDGDTLVVDTTNLNDKTWLHVIERVRRPNLGHLEIEITMGDPKAFTKPHTFNRTYLLRPTWGIQEHVCNEFNVDAERLVGK
jgi:hypothetical protein